MRQLFAEFGGNRLNPLKEHKNLFATPRALV